MKNIVVILLIIVTSITFGQDPSFSQSANNLTYVNPAFTGTSENFRANFSYRNQWPGISGTFITTNVSVDQSVGKFGGVGITYIHDLAGDIFITDNIYLDYAYQCDIGEKSVLSFGVEVGYFQKSLDWSALTFGDMIDARRGFVYTTANTPSGGKVSDFDLGVGVLYYNEFLFAGYALHHINQPNQSIYGGESRLPSLHSFYAGGMINIGDLTISPQVDIKAQGTFQTMLGIVKANYKWVTCGVGYRDQDAVIGYLGFTKERFRVEYSYDYTISKLSSSTGGSHEVSLMLLLNTLKRSNERALNIY